MYFDFEDYRPDTPRISTAISVREAVLLSIVAHLLVVIGYLLLHFHGKLDHAKAISWLAMAGLLMPIGILAAVYFGVPPALVLVGAVAMTVSVVWLGISFYTMKLTIKEAA